MVIVLRAGQTLRGAGRGHSMIKAANATAQTVVADEDTTVLGVILIFDEETGGHIVDVSEGSGVDSIDSSARAHQRR